MSNVNNKIRFFDILFSFFGLIFLAPLLLIAFILSLISTGAPIFTQERIGRNEKIFRLYKYRTMHINTDSLPTHLINPSQITYLGKVIRKTKIDELPQLWNVLIGDMSFVGPRPGLPSQKELVQARKKLGVYKVKPGITGLSQLRNIDMSTPNELARSDFEMNSTFSLGNYFKYITYTVLGRGIR